MIAERNALILDVPKRPGSPRLHREVDGSWELHVFVDGSDDLHIIQLTEADQQRVKALHAYLYDPAEVPVP